MRLRFTGQPPTRVSTLTLDSRWGAIDVAFDDHAIYTCGFSDRRPGRAPARLPAHVRTFLREWNRFGSRGRFSGSFVAVGTPFQQRVWKALRSIPWGRTATYGEIARRIGNPRAVRAVGLANRDNPLPLLIPCHRVIGSNGTLTGYAGGLSTKARLLRAEGAL